MALNDQQGWHRIAGHLARSGRLLAATLVLLGFSACSPGASGPTGLQTAGATTSPPTLPASPEPLPDATSPGTGAGLTCGGPTFPEAGLKAPIGAEKASGPEFDALRATLTAMASEFPGAASWSWRLVGQDATDTIFLAQTDSIEPNGMVAVDVSKGPNGWQPGNMGQGNLRVVRAADPRLDPDRGGPSGAPTGAGAPASSKLVLPPNS